MARNDPLLSSCYRVELGDLGEALFLECAGLSNTTEVVEQWEGGENSVMHKFQGTTKFANITLKNGVGRFTRDLRDMRVDVIEARPPMVFDGSIVQLDDEGKAVARWRFSDAWFCRWEGPEIKGGGNALAIVTLEIACNVWSFEIDDSRYKPPTPPTPEPPDYVTALFTPLQATQLEGTDITLNDQSHGAKPITTWAWSAPTLDGWTASSKVATLKLTKPGLHRVTLKVKSASGKSDAITGIMTVEADYIRAAFDCNPVSCIQGDEVNFVDRSTSSTKITTWAYACSSNNGWAASSQNAKAKFEKPGDYDVELSVKSTSGKEDKTKRLVRVQKEIVEAKFEHVPDMIRDGKLDKFKYIPFPGNSPELRPDAIAILKEAVGVFQDNPGLRVDLNGYQAWPAGDQSDGMTLSINRVKAVQKYMKDQGIGESQVVTAKGMGRTEKFGAGKTEEQLKKNRRVEWLIRNDSTTEFKLRVGDPVRFTDKSIANTSIASWKWECAAMTFTPSDTDPNPTGVFKDPGTHTIILTVKGARGESDQHSITLEVAPKRK